METLLSSRIVWQLELHQNGRQLEDLFFCFEGFFGGIFTNTPLSTVVEALEKEMVHGHVVKRKALIWSLWKSPTATAAKRLRFG